MSDSKAGYLAFQNTPPRRANYCFPKTTPNVRHMPAKCALIGYKLKFDKKGNLSLVRVPKGKTLQKEEVILPPLPKGSLPPTPNSILENYLLDWPLPGVGPSRARGVRTRIGTDTNEFYGLAELVKDSLEGSECQHPATKILAHHTFENWATHPECQTALLGLVANPALWAEAFTNATNKTMDPGSLFVARCALLNAPETIPVEKIQKLLENAWINTPTDNTGVRGTKLETLLFTEMGKRSPKEAARLANIAAHKMAANPPEKGREVRTFEKIAELVSSPTKQNLAKNEKLPWQVRVAAFRSLPPKKRAELATSLSSDKSFPLAQNAVRLCEDIPTLEALATSRGGLKTEAQSRLAEMGLSEPPTYPECEVRHFSSRPAKLLAIDLDDTIADTTTGEILPGDANALRFFANRGSVVITTTRPASYVVDKAHEIFKNKECWIICDDGETTLHYPTMTVTRDTELTPSRRLPRDEAFKVAAESLAAGEIMKVQTLRDEAEISAATDKGSTLILLADSLGVPLQDVAAVGDGRVDIDMFKQVAARGGSCVVVADGQIPAISAPEVGIIAPPRRNGGLGVAIRGLANGILDFPEAQPKTTAPGFFSQLKVTDGAKIRQELEDRGLGDTLASAGRVPFGGTQSTPGHITWVFPRDFPQGTELPKVPKNAKVRAVGIVRDYAGAALSCEVLVDGKWENSTPAGNTPHISLQFIPGIPPVVSNDLLRDRRGWEKFDEPFEVPVEVVQSFKTHA